VQAAADTIEERQAELGFQVSQLPGERRLRQLQLHGCARDAARVGHRDEIPQVPELHAF